MQVQHSNSNSIERQALIKIPIRTLQVGGLRNSQQLQSGEIWFHLAGELQGTHGIVM